jgi:hypothetical protein
MKKKAKKKAAKRRQLWGVMNRDGGLLDFHDRRSDAVASRVYWVRIGGHPPYRVVKFVESP